MTPADGRKRNSLRGIDTTKRASSLYKRFFNPEGSLGLLTDSKILRQLESQLVCKLDAAAPITCSCCNLIVIQAD